MSDRPARPADLAAPLMLPGAHPVPELLRRPVEPYAASAVAAWLDRCAARTGAAPLEDDADDLAVWLGLPEPLLTAGRLAHRLATCLVPADDAADLQALAVGLAAATATTGDDHRVAVTVLVVCLGAVATGTAAALWAHLERSAGPGEVTGAAAALRVLAAHVHAGFAMDELSAGALLAELLPPAE